jgi:hypothetical protein
MGRRMWISPSAARFIWSKEGMREQQHEKSLFCQNSGGF